MNYTIYKVGDEYQKLLNKVFKEDAKIKNSVYFSKTIRRSFSDKEKGEYGRFNLSTKMKSILNASEGFFVDDGGCRKYFAYGWD